MLALIKGEREQGCSCGESVLPAMLAWTKTPVVARLKVRPEHLGMHTKWVKVIG